MIKKLRAMGVLRNLLHLSAVLFTVLMPLALGSGYTDNWDLFFTGVVPATSPIILIVILLDMMMCQIWKSDASPEQVAQLNFAIGVHLIVGVLLTASFLAVFLPVLLP
jgi:hypothetical protein